MRGESRLAGSRPRRMFGRLACGALIASIYTFLLAPIVVVVVASFTPTPILQFPPAGLSLRWFREIIVLGEYVDAFRFSVRVALASTLVSLVLGTWIALVLVRYKFRGQTVLDALFMSPIILPELAFGIGLLQYLSAVGLVSTSWGLVLGHVCLSTPYVIRAVSASLQRFDRSLEESAVSLGATEWSVLRRITLPLIRPGLFAGAVMSFIMSFDNVAVSIFVSAPGQMTLPVRLFIHANETGLNTTLAAVSTLLIALVVGLMILVERVAGLETLLLRPDRHFREHALWTHT